jgi:hypothetical protein
MKLFIVPYRKAKTHHFELTILMSFKNSTASASPFKAQPFDNQLSPVSLIEVHEKVRGLRQMDAKLASKKISEATQATSINTIIEQGCETIRHIEEHIEGLFETLAISHTTTNDEPFGTRMVSHYVSLYYQVLDTILIGSWRHWLETLALTKNPQQRIESFFTSLAHSTSLKMYFLRTAIKCFTYAPILKRYCLDLFFSEIQTLSGDSPKAHSPLNCPFPMILGTILQEHAHSEESLNSILNEIARRVISSEIIKQGLETIVPFLEAKINNNHDTHLLIAPFDAWNLAVKLGASCDLGDFEAVESLVKYIKHRILPIYCETTYVTAKDESLRITAPNANLLFHGLGGGAIEGTIAVTPPRNNSIVALIPANRIIFSHSFFFSREIPEVYEDALLAFIPCESLHSSQPLACQPQTLALVPFLSQYIFHPTIAASPHLWLPQSRHLFTPTVSNTLRQELKCRFSSTITVDEDITTYGSPAGLHDRVIIPDSVCPLEAIAYGWSAKAPELVYESQMENITSKDCKARKVGKIRAQRKFRSLAKRQLNKKSTIETILGMCDISQEIRSLISNFLYRYTLKTLQETIQYKVELLKNRPDFTEQDFLTSIDCYVESSPPFNFDQNLRMFVLGRNFPELRINKHDGDIFDLSALLFKAPERFITFYAERNSLDGDLLNTCKNLQFITEPSSTILSLWNTVLDADSHCIFPQQKNAINATIQKILRPLSEYLIHYGFSFEGGVLLAAKALGLISPPNL